MKLAKVILLLFGVSIFNLGCTHRQLRYDHVMQARSLTTIYEQQVLDNLAMFSKNPDSLPFFVLPNGGSASVTDTGNINIGALNSPIRTNIGPLFASRNNNQQWALAPLTNPRRIERMQLLYQDAISAGLVSKTTGRRHINSECELRGTYCGCSIQVCEGQRSAFTRLVLNVLDAALNDPPAPAAPPAAAPEPTVEVQRFSYNADATVKEVQKFYVKSADIGVDAVVPQSDATSGGSGTSSRSLSSPATSEGQRQFDSILREQQQELLRGVLFPNN